jgi:hypothetical protein
MLEAGVITAIGVIWLLSWMNLKRVAGYGFAWDIIITFVLTWIFIGTYAGMVTGMFAAAIVSVFLRMIRKVAGAERVVLERKDDEILPRAKWKEIK